MSISKFIGKVMGYILICLILFTSIGFIFDSSVRDVVVSTVILGTLLAGISQVRTTR